MPIKDLTENIRMPRLSKLHLGIKDPQRGFPIKTDYFVIKKDDPYYDQFVKVYGEKPKELRVLIPLEDEEKWAQQFYKSYDMTHGLVCKGDGENALRMVDIKTGKLPNKNTETVTNKEMACLGKECPEYKDKKCGEVMNLLFMLPEIPGVGVWQIDTGSVNSILNINSCARIIKAAFGRIAMIPLKLTLEPKEVNNPESGKKQTVFVMHLRTDYTLTQLAEATRNQNKMLQLEAPNLEAVYEEQVQRDIDTLWDGLESASPRHKPKVEAPEPEKEVTPEEELFEQQEGNQPEVKETVEKKLDESKVTKADIDGLLFVMGKVAKFRNAEFTTTDLGDIMRTEFKWKPIPASMKDLKKWQLDALIKRLKNEIGE